MYNELIDNKEDKLEEALALMEAGFTLEEVLAEAGHDAEWLRSMLETATELNELQTAIPIPAPEASLQRLLAYGREQAVSPPPAPPATPSFWTLLFGGGFRVATSLATAFLLLFLLGGSLTLAAQNSLPGDYLYSLKRTSENLRLQLTGNSEQLQNEFNQRRLIEIENLLEAEQAASIEFKGEIQAVINNNVLLIENLQVQMVPETTIKGQLTPQSRVQIEGTVHPPIITALTITVLEAGVPVPTFTPTLVPTETLVPTHTPLPTHTATSLPDTPTPTVTPLPTNSPTPQPTFTLPPTAETMEINPSPALDNTDDLDDAFDDFNDNTDDFEEEDADYEDFVDDDDDSDDEIDDDPFDNDLPDPDDDSDDDDDDDDKGHGNDPDKCDEDNPGESC